MPLALVSLSALGYEIALTRYFAVALWSDYGYWVISIVMAGFALSGAVLALARDAAERHGVTVMRALPALLVATAGIGFHLVIINPFNPLQLQNSVTWTSQLCNIGGYYLALLPFFFLAGLFVSLSFVLNSDRIGTVYAWDLTGAGIGAALVLALMFVLHPFHLVPALLVPLAASCLFVGRGRAIAATASLLIAVEALLLFGSQPHVNDFKPIYAPQHTPGARLLARINSPRGNYALLDDFTERVDVDISNDAGMLHLPGPPRSFGLYRDGERIAALPKPGSLDVGYAWAALDALPYVLISHPRVLLVGASGGFRIAEVRALGASRVVALEPEPVLRAALRHGLDLSPALPAMPGVTLKGQGPLAAVQTHGLYDLIDISADFLDTAPGNAAAFTTEALAADLRALAQGGMVSVPVSIRDFPVYALRMLATARAALHMDGIAAPETHIVVYRSAWNARLLISPTPFAPSRIAALRRFCDQRSFDVSWYPGINVREARANVYNDLPAISFAAGEVATGGPDDSIADEAGAVLAGQPTASGSAFSLAPITLDRPFFYAALRLSDVGLLLRRLEVLPQQEISALVNLAVLVQAALIALVVLLVPAVAPGRMRPQQGGFLRVALYFSCLGLGFFFIEIFLIAQASLWLDDRTSGFALVLTGMLVFSGIGSAFSGRFDAAPRLGMTLATAVIVLWSTAVLAGLLPLLLTTLGAPWLLRAALVLALTVPVSLALGLPFPLGLSRLGRGGALPWAWALNGAFSVVATPLANLIAREVGYDRVLACAAVLYVLALAEFPAVGRHVAWLHQPLKSPGAR